jgi:hypothetical protein
MILLNANNVVVRLLMERIKGFFSWFMKCRNVVLDKKKIDPVLINKKKIDITTA